MKRRHLGLAGWEWLLLLAALLLFVLQAGFSSRQKSAAFDEEYHLAAGYAYLRTGDFRLSSSHPPLVNALSALPLLAVDGVQLPLEHPSWAAGDYFNFSDVFLWQTNDNPQRLLALARLPLMALGALLAALLFAWGRQWAGPAAGWAALLLSVADPNLLANSRLVTTDLGLTLFLALAVWRFWRWLERPGWPNLLLAGVAAGLAMATKFTGLLVWPIFLGILLLQPRARARRWSGLGHLALMGLLAYATVWAVFRFDTGPIPGAPRSLPVPAPFYPASIWETFRVIEEQPKTSFLLGETSPRGWWYYFPVALAVKTPLPLLLLAGAGLALLLRRGWRAGSVLWLPPLLVMALAMSGRITIGYRHILPVVPFLILLAAMAAAALWEKRQWRLALAVLLAAAAWQAAETALIFPHYEAYFNPLAGGPGRGHEILVDSNVDWGQDLIALRELLAERGIERVNLAYFGTALPEAYGISYQPLPAFLRFLVGPEVHGYNPYTPPPGWYAISVTSLQLGLLFENVDMYAYFREREPAARAGYSIHLYQVSYPEETELVRTTVTSTAVSDVAAEALGVAPERRVIAKWSESPATRIMPAGEHNGLPPGAQPARADFGGAFTLLGYELEDERVTAGGDANLTLYWQVGSAAVETPAPSRAGPLAAFVHLSGDDPAQIAAQYDGWEAALTGLERGDLIAQRITLPLPAGTAPGAYYLRTGLYSPQSGQRLSLVEGGDLFVLGTLEVSAAAE